MGWDYVQFRALYEIKRKTGLLKRQFPANPPIKAFISLKEWKERSIPFFFEAKAHLEIPKHPDERLQEEFEAFTQGKLRYFNATFLEIGKDYNWLTNPSNGYQYDAQKHWTEVEDISATAGDIKFTWEKSRFSFLYTLIRYDYHFEQDCSEMVFKEMEDWIQANPINQGPNYKCSQEISLRVMNWTFALYYYKNSPHLSEARFEKIMHTIYWQLKHVYANINFSRKTVRNNHAITEVLMLYLSGLLFPFFPESSKWKRKGKQWFEQEIAYQVYEDGTFLQFSHNYHRVLIQLLSWAFYLADIHDDQFTALTYQRAKKSLHYLFQCTRSENGHLPNHGANDGALFFKFNNQAYRDYRPQLNALNYFFNRKPLFDQAELTEDIHWLSSNLKTKKEHAFCLEKQKVASFDSGGYYTINDGDSLTFIKCGSYKDRPSHADNLHLDIWHKGQNILRDAGTYKYNTDQELLRYFNGTPSHNTLSLGDHDQMLKGPRFIWLHWSNALAASLTAADDHFLFTGKIHAFKHIAPNIYHQRQVKKYKSALFWEIEDQVEHKSGLAIRQYWNIGDGFKENFMIFASDEHGKTIEPIFKKGLYSSFYGIKEESEVIIFETSTNKITTSIKHQ